MLLYSTCYLINLQCFNKINEINPDMPYLIILLETAATQWVNHLPMHCVNPMECALMHPILLFYAERQTI
jgi:hypothetical protein